MHIELTRDELRAILISLSKARHEYSLDTATLPDDSKLVSYAEQQLTQAECAYSKMLTVYQRVHSKVLAITVEE